MECMKSNFDCELLLSKSNRRSIFWQAVDDGSVTGSIFGKPTHFYIIKRDENQKAFFDFCPLSDADSHIESKANGGKLASWRAISLVNTFINPAAAKTKAYIIGLVAGFFLTLGSIVTALLLSQIAVDKAKQEEIRLEAEKAIAMCSTQNLITQGEVDKARESLARYEELAGIGTEEGISADTVEDNIDSEAWSPPQSESVPSKEEQWMPQ